MTELPTVSILLPAHHPGLLLRKCLESLRQLEYPSEKVEIILVFDVLTPGATAVAKNYRARAVLNRGKGIAAGRSTAFAESTGEVIAFCDADCVVHPQWIANALKYFVDPEVGGIGGPIPVPKQNAIAEAARYFYKLAVHVSRIAHAEQVERMTRVSFVPTINFICRREALREVFPIRWEAPYGSDLGISLGIRRNGFTLLRVPDVCVWHHKRSTVHGFVRELYFYGRGRIYYQHWSGESLRISHIIAASFLPLLIGTAFVMPLIPPIVVAALIGLCALGFLSYFSWVFFLSKAFSTSLLSPLILILGIGAWSLGCICEWIRLALYPAIQPFAKGQEHRPI